MLIVFLKSVFIFCLVLLVVRLMGKRQIGEMEPFELVITLIIAEVACIPMNDPYIPFYYGIIPILTLMVLQIAMSFFSRKSLFVRRVLSGRSIIVIDKDGINYENLKKMNINIHDLIEAVSSSGYPDMSSIAYAIFEPNGKLCVIEKPSDPTKPSPAYLPLTLIVDGKFADDNLKLCGITVPQLNQLLSKHKIKNFKDILFADVRQDGTVFVAPKYAKSFTEKASIPGGKNW